MKDSKRLYYLDDDSDDLAFFRDTAEQLGHTVFLFADGNELLTALRKKPYPDIVFLDIHMPIYGGEEILDIIRKSDDWKEIPIVMISGILQKKLVRHYLDAGANHLMKKPGATDWKAMLESVLDINWNTYQAFN